MHIIIPTLATLTSKCTKNSLLGYQVTVVPFHMTIRCQIANTLFAWLISRTFSTNEQCFSLTTNQRTVFSAMAFQPSEQVKRLAIPVLATLTTTCAKNSVLGIQVTVVPFRTTIWMQSDGIQCPFVCNNFEFPI
jgi:hypothetical protein